MYIQTSSKSVYECLGERGQAHMLGTYMFPCTSAIVLLKVLYVRIGTCMILAGLTS